MPLNEYLLRENTGSQRWQMMASNYYSGSHPYNFSGFCMALVVQWLQEIKAEEGQSPVEIGRKLLNSSLGPKGYEGIAYSQEDYGGDEVGISQDDAMVRKQTGYVYRLLQEDRAGTDKNHWLYIRNRIYQRNDFHDTIRLDDRAKVYSGLMGIGGKRKWMSCFMGDSWAHAIGVYSTQHQISFFDPNYGIFIFAQDRPGNIVNFIQELWKDYGVTWGSIADFVNMDQ